MREVPGSIPGAALFHKMRVYNMRPQTPPMRHNAGTVVRSTSSRARGRALEGASGMQAAPPGQAASHVTAEQQRVAIWHRLLGGVV